jgi:hypothetical protein
LSQPKPDPAAVTLYVAITCAFANEKNKIDAIINRFFENISNRPFLKRIRDCSPTI